MPTASRDVDAGGDNGGRAEFQGEDRVRSAAAWINEGAESFDSDDVAGREEAAGDGGG